MPEPRISAATVARIRRGIQIAVLKRNAGIPPDPDVRRHVERINRAVKIKVLELEALEKAAQLPRR